MTTKPQNKLLLLLSARLLLLSARWNMYILFVMLFKEQIVLINLQREIPRPDHGRGHNYCYASNFYWSYKQNSSHGRSLFSVPATALAWISDRSHHSHLNTQVRELLEHIYSQCQLNWWQLSLPKNQKWYSNNICISAGKNINDNTRIHMEIVRKKWFLERGAVFFTCKAH